VRHWTCRRSATALVVGATLLASTSLWADADELFVGHFSKGSTAGWEEKSFEGETDYSIVETSRARVLRARCDDSASGLFRDREIDLTETPVLNWSWRVDDTYGAIDETKKAGDDYPARIYVVVESGLFGTSKRAVNYVWSSNQKVGSRWSNAYADEVTMIAVDSGSPSKGVRWRSHSRNVRRDLERALGEDVDSIDAVAVMTDCDNTDESTTAYYGDISFSKN
jgi:hypothetical protein